MTEDDSHGSKRILIGLLVVVVLIGIAVIIFFVAHKSNSLPSQYAANRTNFSTSIEDASKATSVLDNNDNTKLANSLISQSVAASKNVSNAFLDYLSPRLKDEYRNNLIKGEQDYFQGVEESTRATTQQNSGTELQEEGTDLERSWISWWDVNYVTLYNKAYSDKNQ
jgi:flagellar basal body-associated protein FliL